jgi:hypothetical protein
MIISIDAEKAFGKNPVSLYDKSLRKLGKEILHLNIVEAIYWPTCTQHYTE